MKFGIALGTLHPRYWVDAVVEADRLGFESAWISEHLVIPTDLTGSPFAGETHPPIPPETPVHDAVGYLCYLAAVTQRIRLGTYVYLLGLRHPFVPARGFATLDLLSGGRAVLGAGSGWLRGEWEAAGIDPSTRGGRLDESIALCRRLWTEEVVEHHGRYFDFGPVAFEPKPVQSPIPIHIGGTSDRALQRVARLGDGWLGMRGTPEDARRQVSDLRHHLEAAGRPASAVEVTMAGGCDSLAELADWADAGVDRLVVTPWARSRLALESLQTFADRFLSGRSAAPRP